MMFRHLLWKDTMVVKPLVAAILIGIIAINLITFLIATTIQDGGQENLFVSLWALMPNLVALGAPALLVGGEEENGTLDWLRTLPVSWKRIADSKFLVGSAAFAISWVASSLVLGVMLTFVQRNLPGQFDPGSFADSMLSPASICYLLFFSLLLLICGYITAYLFRSPVAGLLAVVPLICIANIVSIDVGHWMRTGDRRYAGVLEDFHLASDWPVVIAAFVLLVAMWSLQRMLACRRLTSCQTDRLKNLTSSESDSAYRPPAVVGASRPSPTAALLWQQFRQIGWLASALTVMVAFFLTLHLRGPQSYSSTTIGFLYDVSIAVIAIGASWIGGLSFYGDSLRRRCDFFADRGVRPGPIWWTRIAIPLVCCCALVLLVAVMWRLGPGADGIRYTAAVVLILVMFAFGQLVSQWTRRPTLTFFAAPAFASIACAMLMWLFAIYPTYHLCALLIVPVLLFASWCLAGRWLSNRVDGGYHWRVVAYSMLAVALPMIAVPAARIWTTPEPMPLWRSQMLSARLPEPVADGDNTWVYGPNIAIGTFYGTVYSKAFEQLSTAERLAMLQEELASERIGDHVSFADIDQALGRQSISTGLQDEWIQAAVEVLLKWDLQIRRSAAKGTISLWELEVIAEPAERRLVETLERTRMITPAVMQLIEAIPDSELRKQSRRVALMTAWRDYAHEAWRHDYGQLTTYGKTFARHNIGYPVASIGFEQTRCDRYIDRLTRLLLDQLNEGLPSTDVAPSFQLRDQLWTEANGPRSYTGQQAICPIGKLWTRDYETRIDRLKARIVIEAPKDEPVAP